MRRSVDQSAVYEEVYVVEMVPDDGYAREDRQPEQGEGHDHDTERHALRVNSEKSGFSSSSWLMSRKRPAYLVRSQYTKYNSLLKYALFGSRRAFDQSNEVGIDSSDPVGAGPRPVPACAGHDPGPRPISLCSAQRRLAAPRCSPSQIRAT